MKTRLLTGVIALAILLGISYLTFDSKPAAHLGKIETANHVEKAEPVVREAVTENQWSKLEKRPINFDSYKDGSNREALTHAPVQESGQTKDKTNEPAFVTLKKSPYPTFEIQKNFGGKNLPEHRRKNCSRHIG